MIINDAAWLEIDPWMVDIRRKIHRTPEMGLETFGTQALVETVLDDLNIQHERPIPAGVKAVLGPQDGDAILLRADMDALPIQEQTGLSFSSEVPGVMHACGHDSHTAMLLGAARYLKMHEHALQHPVVLMFQPGEEGPGGALPMIKAGILDNPTIKHACMVHIADQLPARVIGLREGPAMGSCDDFLLRVHGRGGHGSAPHTGVDAILISAAIVQALQAVVSREQDPLDACVVTIGTIHGGYRENIIADRVEMTGTIRTLLPSTRQFALERVQAVAQQVAAMYRATVDVEITEGYPPLIADIPWTRAVKSILQNNLGPEFVTDISQPTLGVEDFAYVAERVPATVLNLGIRGPQFTTGLHSAGLLLDETALKYGAAALTSIALNG